MPACWLSNFLLLLQLMDRYIQTKLPNASASDVWFLYDGVLVKRHETAAMVSI
jgi:hypothetical protein